MHQTRNIVEIVQEYSLPLIAGVFLGLITANLDHTFHEQVVDYHFLGKDAYLFDKPVTIHFVINEMFMVLFFGVAAKEITDAALPGGVLNPIRRAINPLLGTLGGVFGPVMVFFLLTWLFYGGSQDFSRVANGWGIATATDIALAWLIARVVFGQFHPAVSFLLFLAVVDDAIGLGIIAIFYPDPELPVEPVWLLLTLAGMGAALGLRLLKVRFWPLYILVGGALSWVGLAKSAIEPALALVVIVPFLPSDAPAPSHSQHDGEHEGEPANPEPAAHPAAHGESPLESFEHRLKLPVDLGLFFFAFANAGVTFGAINQVTFIILLSLILGKTIGISGFSLLARQLGFPLPAGMGVRHLVVTGLIGGIGLTVALFVAAKAYSGPPFQEPAKMGAVLSGGISLLAIALGYFLKVKEDEGDGHS